MPNTGPTVYYWVGGSTGSTSASRFDWNVASNWRVRVSNSDKVSEYNLKAPDYWPAGGDSVKLGFGYEFIPGTTSSHQITSPLLFGGWSGSGNTGCWICAGQTGSGLSGASGTTFNVNIINFEVDNYPWSGIGGGLTGSQVFGYPSRWYLPSMQVSGMSEAAWLALGDAATDRQKTLKLKVNNVNYLNVAKEKGSGVYTPQAWFAPVIVDSFISLGVSGAAYIGTNINFPGIADYGSWSWPRLYLADSKVLTIEKSVSNMIYPGQYSYGQGLTAEPLDIILDNCTVGYIATVPAGTVTINPNCTVGKFSISDGGYSNIENNGMYVSLGGVYKHYTALVALGYPGSTLAADDAEVNIQWNNKYYTSINLGLSGPAGLSGSFTANRVLINNGVTATAKNTFVSFRTKAYIGEMVMENATMFANYYMDNNTPVEITTLRLRQNAVVDFRSNSRFDNWRFGLASASASGLTLNGGLIFESATSSILGDPGIRFINYGKSATIDLRNQKPLGLSDIAVPPAEAL